MAFPEVLISAGSFVGAWALLQICYPSLLKILKARNMFRSNYLGKFIPISVGVLIPFSHFAFLPWSMVRNRQMFLIQVFALILMAYAGWKDDRWGGTEAKGLRGHIQFFLSKRKISTGLWKAIIGSIIALTISFFFSSSLLTFALHFLLMVLMTNLINLMDLRPGRAMKTFFLLFFILLGVSFGGFPGYHWLPVVATALFLFPDDIKANVMLGDAGANCLGMALGIWMVWFAPIWFQLIMLWIAIGVHFYAEKKSITALIQTNPLLEWVDMLGRNTENHG